MIVKLRFVELEANKIFNWLNPMNVTCWCAFHEWHSTWWEPETVNRREHFAKIWTEEFDKITGHFSRLEESIQKDGMHHPINAVSGSFRCAHLKDQVNSTIAFPPELQARPNETIYSHTFGGSRLTIAQKYGMTVPCAIHDFENLFNEQPEITAQNYKEWFGDSYIFTTNTPYLRIRSHTHITEAKYSVMNNETRKAQRAATQIAKEQSHV